MGRLTAWRFSNSPRSPSRLSRLPRDLAAPLGGQIPRAFIAAASAHFHGGCANSVLFTRLSHMLEPKRNTPWRQASRLGQPFGHRFRDDAIARRVIRGCVFLLVQRQRTADAR